VPSRLVPCRIGRQALGPKVVWELCFYALPENTALWCGSLGLLGGAAFLLLRDRGAALQRATALQR
jgi:hypothetical protein